MAVGRIELPPLRERSGDAELLAEHFWTTLGGERALPRVLLERLRDYSWPGNVRELKNTVARLAALGDLGPAQAKKPSQISPDSFDQALALDLPCSQARALFIHEFERRYVARALDQHQGNVSKAAEASGLARRYFRILRAKKRDGA